MKRFAQFSTTCLNSNRYRIYLLFVSVLSFFLLFNSPTASADPPSPPKTSTVSPAIGVNGGIAPDYVFTPEEIQRMLMRDIQAQKYYLQKKSDNAFAMPQPDSIGGKTLAVGYWPEPNDPDHVNYCGPAATQVAIDARLPSGDVPDLETLAAEEKLDPSWGVYMTDLCPVLNNHLNTTRYGVSSASSSSQFYAWVVSDIDNNYALVTGVRTDNMPGWDHGANHIVAIHGYWEPTGSYQTIKYVETASPIAGYTGSYYQSVERNTFFGYVVGNNVQCW